jgi:Putative DNA-binding domain
MSLLHIPLDQIIVGHLQGLIDASVPEAATIEYKRGSYGTNDDARTEFLADICSFANTRGGDLILGMEAGKDSIPVRLVPLAQDIDNERVRLDQMARAGLEPRIPNINIKPVQLTTGGFVLVIRIPRSYRLPHRVIFKGRNRFYARSSGGRYEPDVDQLRMLFTLAPQLAERMREFRMDRIMRITADDAPVRLLDHCCLVLHVVPFSSFDLQTPFRLEEAIRKAPNFTPMMRQYPEHNRINFDGLLTLGAQAGKDGAYVQVFRSGAVEAVWSSIAEDAGNINIHIVDVCMVHYSRIYTMLLKECGAEPPFAVMASLIGVIGKGLTTGRQSFQGGFEGEYSDRDQLHLTETIFEDVPSGDPECGTFLRTALDQLANAAGLLASPSFDRNGNYQQRLS